MSLDPSIFKQALTNAAALTSGVGYACLPVNINEIADKLGVTKIELRPMKASGLLVASGGEIAIFARESDPDHRRRFTIAHELGHLLLARAAGQDISSFHRGRNRYDGEERAADRLAAELLMPGKLVLSVLNKCGQENHGWRCLQILRQKFAVSLSSIALRVLEIEGVAAVLFREQVNDGDMAKHSVDCSRGLEISFYAKPFDLMQSLWDSNGKHSDLDVCINGERSTLRMHFLKRDLSFNGGRSAERWIIGWNRIC